MVGVWLPSFRFRDDFCFRSVNAPFERATVVVDLGVVILVVAAGTTMNPSSSDDNGIRDDDDGDHDDDDDNSSTGAPSISPGYIQQLTYSKTTPRMMRR